MERTLPTNFREQFIKCADEKMHVPGPLQKFKDYPQLLPAFWHPAAPKFAKLLKKDPEAGLTPLLCLKFGGECSSANPDCMRLRGWTEEEIQSRGKKWIIQGTQTDSIVP
jgi:hypothetical protein